MSGIIALRSTTQYYAQDTYGVNAILVLRSKCGMQVLWRKRDCGAQASQPVAKSGAEQEPEKARAGGVTSRFAAKAPVARLNCRPQEGAGA
jgi:hypothetical protein